MAIEKNTTKKTNKRIGGRHVKHSPMLQNRSQIDLETTYLVKSASPFMSAFKKISKTLSKFDKAESSNSKYRNGHYKDLKYMTIKGMGKSMEKTLNLGLKFRDELDYKVDIFTGSSEVIDEFRKDANNRYDSEEDEEEMEEEEEIVYKKRMVSSVEVRIWLKK